ncbi:MAG: TraR/DksA C4-type zinc finger protein [Actinomycetota bacterium]|nr:TraR/DksA C4-type zinc finger protein [Actinomycetota bacterium]
MTKAQKASTAEAAKTTTSTAKKGTRASKAAKTPDRSATTRAATATRTATKPGAKKARAPKLAPFVVAQRQRLTEERNTYLRSANELKAQADSLALEHEPGDVQFDEEGGEGGTSNVDRELDLVLSAQALAAVNEIDFALEKILAGTYGLCEQCGQPIPEARLEALPHAALCVACKSGGLSSRR